MKMSLEEAIKKYKNLSECQKSVYRRTNDIEEEIQSKVLMNEYNQLTEWLTELKQRRDADKAADAQLRELIEEVKR